MPDPTGDPDIPEAVERLCAEWLRQYQRTGHIPERAVYGRGEHGELLWCSLADAGPDLLEAVALYHRTEARRKLARYRDDPNPALAHEIAGHLLALDVADELREWSGEDKAQDT
jgi:hypothetical protein